MGPSLIDFWTGSSQWTFSKSCHICIRRGGAAEEAMSFQTTLVDGWSTVPSATSSPFRPPRSQGIATVCTRYITSGTRAAFYALDRIHTCNRCGRHWHTDHKLPSIARRRFGPILVERSNGPCQSYSIHNSASTHPETIFSWQRDSHPEGMSSRHALHYLCTPPPMALQIATFSLGPDKMKSQISDSILHTFRTYHRTAAANQPLMPL